MPAAFESKRDSDRGYQSLDQALDQARQRAPTNIILLLFVLACKLTQSCKIAFLTLFRPAFALGLFLLS
jgi:hypothetical protein